MMTRHSIGYFSEPTWKPMGTQRYSGFAWPTACVLVAGIYGYWAQQGDLDTARPESPTEFELPSPPPALGLHSFSSRLWEDPLATAQKDWNKRNKGNSKEGRTVSDRHAEAVLTGWIADASDQKDQKKLDLAFGWDVAIGRWKIRSGSELSAKTVSSDGTDSQPIQGVRTFLSELVAEGRETGTICMPVFLPGGPYAADKERRKRARYAVITALAESEYRPRNSSAMSYAVPKVWVKIPGGWQEREIVVPMNVYEPLPDGSEAEEEDQPQVLVLWINENQLGDRPLLSTHRVLNSLFREVEEEDCGGFVVSIIGPASSDGLVMMEEEEPHLRFAAAKYQVALGVKSEVPRAGYVGGSHWQVDSYGPRVETEGFQPLLYSTCPGRRSELGGTPKPRPLSIFSSRATANLEWPNCDVVKLHRVVGTDDKLVCELMKELRVRGVNRGKVVLITEHDTAYGQRMERDFRDHKNCLDDKCTMEGHDYSRLEIEAFKMLRGVDGRRPGDNSEAGASKGTSSSTRYENDIGMSPDPVRPPKGRSQYDYLRRLRHRIEALHDVRAIGVVGSDVYDKLLVIRALKPHFPGCVFFTTDMHSIYNHPSESAHSRNLIIASHYGLRLSRDLQKHTPPFRDSYQTATFYATRLAVEPGRDGQSPNNEIWTRWRKTAAMPPTVLGVVGRTYTQQIRPGTSDELGVQPDPEDRAHAGPYFVIISLMIAACVIGGLALADVEVRALADWGAELPSLVRTAIRTLVLAGPVLLVVIYAGWNGEGNQTDFFGAHSSWPRTVVQTLCGFCGVLASAYVLAPDGWRCAPESGRDQQPNLSSEFRLTQLESTWILVLSLVVLAFGATCAFASPYPGLLLAGGAIIGVSNIRLRCDTDLGPQVPKLGRLVGLGLCMAFAVGLLREWGWLRYLPPGWSAITTSRGIVSRIGDLLAVGYCFASIAVLLVSILYCTARCRVIAMEWERWKPWLDSKRIFNTADEAQRPGLEPDIDPNGFPAQLELLEIIGTLTATPGRFVPVFIGLLFTAVLAYHPAISPEPMPASTLVFFSLGAILLLLATITSRIYFRGLKLSVVTRIERELRDRELPGGGDVKKERTDTGRGTDSAGEGGGEPANKQVRVMLQLADGSEAAFADASMETETATNQAVVVLDVLNDEGRPGEGDEDNADSDTEVIALYKKHIEAVSTGVFSRWDRSPIGMLLGGSALVAFVDVWLRWWVIEF